MRTDTLFRRYEIFVGAATIAAHANSAEEGFRQRDVRFLIELFTNWVEHSIEGGILSVKNTQVLRYLEELVTEGFAKKTRKQKQPKYRLTRVGLLELMNRLSSRSSGGPEHFFFLLYFLSNYGPKISELIRTESSQFPIGVRLEIEILLDWKRLLKEEIVKTERELRKLSERVETSQRSTRLAAKLFAKGADISEVVGEIEKNYPYQLNSQKPLSELFAGIPTDITRWELETGGMKRIEQIWFPARTILSAYLHSLKQFEQSMLKDKRSI